MGTWHEHDWKIPLEGINGRLAAALP
jgi:hypothetical protein